MTRTQVITTIASIVAFDPDLPDLTPKEMPDELRTWIPPHYSHLTEDEAYKLIRKVNFANRGKDQKFNKDDSISGFTIDDLIALSVDEIIRGWFQWKELRDRCFIRMNKEVGPNSSMGKLTLVAKTTNYALSKIAELAIALQYHMKKRKPNAEAVQEYKTFSGTVETPFRDALKAEIRKKNAEFDDEDQEATA